MNINAPDGPDSDDEEDHQEQPWLLIYGDLMSLLLVFFILLLAVSDINEEKFQAIINGISNALGGDVVYVYVAPPDAKAELVDEIDAEERALRQAERQMRDYIDTQSLQDQADVALQEEGLRLTLQGEFAFDSGSAEIKPIVVPHLLALSDYLRDLPNPVVVEGHTDDRPINTVRFASNWELSTARATNIVRFYLDNTDIAPRRLSAAGYAFYRPLFAFDSVDNPRNRRVEILMRRTFDTAVAERIRGL